MSLGHRIRLERVQMEARERAGRSKGNLSAMKVARLVLLSCFILFVLGCSRQKEAPLPPIVNAWSSQIPDLRLRDSEQINRSKALQVRQLFTTAVPYEQVVQQARTWLQSISDEPILERGPFASFHEFTSYSVNQSESAKVFGDEIVIKIYKPDPSQEGYQNRYTTITFHSYFLKNKSK